jgi:hypothetical protein
MNRFEERQIGLVRIQQDRYVAREAGAEWGSLLTPLVVLDAAEMTLNVDASNGQAAVQVLNCQGQPIAGFARKDCTLVTGDRLDAPVRWQRSLAELKGQPVRIEFFLQQARLFAFGLK